MQAKVCLNPKNRCLKETYAAWADILIDRTPRLGALKDCESIMAYRLKWKTQPSATRICWLTTGTSPPEALHAASRPSCMS